MAVRSLLLENFLQALRRLFRLGVCMQGVIHNTIPEQAIIKGSQGNNIGENNDYSKTICGTSSEK